MNNINWNSIEKEYPELFSELIFFIRKRNNTLESLDKNMFNEFITESKFPIFLTIDDKFRMSDYNVKLTFQGMVSFLAIKK
jgi:hypothetical protein